MSGYSKRCNLMIPSWGVYNATATTSVGTDRVGSSITVSNAFVYQGASSIKLSAGASGLYDVYNGLNTQYYYQVPSTTFTVSMYLRRGDGGSFDLTNVASVRISTVLNFNQVTQTLNIQPLANNWWQISGTLTSTLSTVEHFGVVFFGSIVGIDMYIGAWQIEAGPVVTPWE